MPPKSVVFGLCVLFTCCACQSNPTHRPSNAADVQEDTYIPRDANVDVDTGDVSSSGDAHDTTDTKLPDTDGPASDAEDSDTGSDTLSFDASRWQQENHCQGEVSYPPENEPFSKPGRSQDYEPVLTRQEVIRDFSGLPLQGLSIRPAEGLHAGPGKAYDLYTDPGTDVTLHVYVINDYTPEELESFRLMLTTMVDYESVEARYERWNPERTERWLDTNATGINVPIRSDVEIIDVTIPGEVFAEERMYEIALSFETTTTERAPFGESQRFALYNGGYNRPKHPCAEPRLDDVMTPIEERLRTRIAGDIGILFFEGIESREDLRRTIPVEPGATKEFYLSVFRESVQYEAKPTVMIPLMNGQPIGPTWWVTQGGDPEGTYRLRFDARKTFEVTFPQEPGIYEIQAASWIDPFKIYRERDGTVHRDISDGGGIKQNSNALRFEVVEN